ncbi:phosphoadenosine phosphosulfate reductase [Streptomyces phage phiSASD1]|uniref:Gp3 n=1 Tax=Streptomyces phage phiSASD1 TaxID=747763 RepID=D7NW72_9CAUD|nr:phosphoadenosine phosphosulfate reductase [Streptomyces phage phiSASD1]ADE43470.1 gp3 [Streptomyces phage phiSASD1]
MDVVPIPFPVTSAAALALKRTPDQVARMTRPEREDRVQRLVGYAHWMVDRAIAQHFDKRSVAAIAVLYSGGNDSTTLAHIFRQRATCAVHANTTIGVEATREFVRETCAGWGLPLLEKRPQASYRDLVLERGFPGPGQHFKMYQRLKERCLEQARSELVGNPFKERVLFLGGRRRSESRRRAGLAASDRKGSMVFTSPLVLWTKLDMNTYRLMCGDVPVNEVSELIHMSGECLCGSFATKGELEEVGFWFPQVREEIEALEEELADRTDIPEIRRKWGWGAYRADLAALKARGHFKSGAMCTSCDSRATGGEVIAV